MKEQTGSLPLRVVDERATLPEVALATLKRGPKRGGWTETRVGGFLDPARLGALLQDKVGGAPQPWWAGGADGATRGPIAVVRAKDVWLAPGHGALIDGEGQVYASTVGEMLSWTPDLAALPSVRRDATGPRFEPPSGLTDIPAATVFLAKGGEFNYGHYLLDCLPSLLAVAEQGLLAEAPPIAPPLNRWRRDLFDLAFPGQRLIETRAPLVRLGEAAFATSLDHFLHRPNRILLDLRERMLANAPPAGSAERIYISRRGYPMRVMVNEAALEAALQARGFRIVRAEQLSVGEQIALMRGAKVIVGASGAGLANALFAPEGAKVVEILPDTFAAPWLRNLSHLAGLDWRGWFCPAPIDAREAAWTFRIRRGFRWAFRLQLEGFLSFLDRGL